MIDTSIFDTLLVDIFLDVTSLSPKSCLTIFLGDTFLLDDTPLDDTLLVVSSCTDTSLAGKALLEPFNAETSPEVRFGDVSLCDTLLDATSLTGLSIVDTSLVDTFCSETSLDVCFGEDTLAYASLPFGWGLLLRVSLILCSLVGEFAPITWRDSRNADLSASVSVQSSLDEIGSAVASILTEVLCAADLCDPLLPGGL